ncbi:uncharacterized protein [Battus philenor]|uniref:uncharacterized protein n=1 Tax=Battus philenor TaxID=42288 RepID=UPI0035D127CD
MKRHMVRHFKTKHQSLYVKVQPLIKRKTDIVRPVLRTSSFWVKKYCTNMGNSQYQCDICQKILKMPRAHGNMKRHIKLKHPEIYEMENQLMLIDSEPTSINVKDNSDFNVEEVLLEQDEVLEEAEEYLEEYDIEESNVESKSMPEIDAIEDPSPEEIAYQNVDDLDTESDTNDFGDIDYLSEKDPDYESKVKWLAQRIVPGKRKTKACTWNFFNIVEENHIYSCIFCQKDVAIVPFSSSNLKRHLRINHKRAFNIIAKYGPEFRNKNANSLKKFIESGKPADDFTKSFEKSYFETQADNKFKCKSCEEIIELQEQDSVMLFKHIYEKHSDEVISHIKDNVDDDEEFSVLFVKKKDLQVLGTDHATEAAIPRLRYARGKAGLVSVAPINEPEYFFIPTARGTQLLMVNGHTFSQNNHARNMYYCSKRSAKCCKSSVRLNDEGRIVSIKEDHTHPPPKYAVTDDGTYLKISS